MAKTTKSSSKKTKVKLTVKDLVISTEELMEKIESSQFEGTLDEFIKLWKTSLSEGEYQYPDYVDAVNQLKSKKYKGADYFSVSDLDLIRSQRKVNWSKVIKSYRR